MTGRRRPEIVPLDGPPTRRPVLRAAVAAGAAIGLYALAVRFRAGDGSVNLRILLVVLGTLAGLLVLSGLRPARRPGRRSPGTQLDRLARPRAADEPPPPLGLKQAGSSVTSALRSASGRDRWLRADIRSIVSARLDPIGPAARGPATDPGRWARELGPDTWELVRPDRPSGAAGGPGLTPEQLDRILTDLERL